PARSDPRSFPTGWGMEVRVDRAGDRPLGSLVWVSGRGEAARVAAGDRVRGAGRFRRVEGEEGFERYLADRGVAALVSASELGREGPPRNPLLRVANGVRDALAAGARRALPPRRAGLLLGLTIGDTRGMHPETVEDFRATGLGHLVAVSGSNVVMVLAPVVGLAALLGMGPRGRLAAGGLAVVLFALITRWEPSVLRAGVMAGLALLGVAAGRPRETATVLSWAVVILLLVDPRLSRSLAFQLSTAATVGLVALAPGIEARLRWLPRPVALAAAATAGAQAAVTPLLLGAFGIVPGSTLIANVLAFPAVAAAFLGGSTAAAVALVWPGLGSALGTLASMPIAYLEAVADRTARLAVPALVGADWVPPVALAVVAHLVLRRVVAPRRAALLLGAPFLVWIVFVRGSPPPGLEVRFLDVGQGDAALVRTPRATILVDAGPDEQTVATRLAALGIGRLDLAVASHGHQDHVEGFPAVLARHPVGLLLDPGCPTGFPSHERMLDAAAYEDVPIRHPRGGERLRVGDLLLEVLGPDECAPDSPNDDSIVLRLVHGSATVLLPGDAEVPAQLDLLSDADPVRATVLKVPHHGSSTSDPSFFETVAASVAVVSVGEDNDFGHPVPDTLRALREAGGRVVRTDLAGEVTVTFEGDRPVVERSR
ncbi:MAG TPA: ComEC/Rec2 family competence protein, partial [Actinomycetota bacterium]